MSFRLAFFSESIANARLDSRLTGGKLIHQSGRKRTPLGSEKEKPATFAPHCL